MKVYAYTVHISAPDKFAAGAIMGTLWQVADEAPVPCAVQWISEALWKGDIVEEFPDDLDPDGIDTIPLF